MTKDETQYRIVESRSGESFDPFFEVEFREHGYGYIPFFKTWGNWIKLGSDSASGFGKGGLHRCKAWIADQRKKTPENYYSGRVVFTEDTTELSDGAQFLQQAEFQTSEHWENRPRWVDPA